MLIFTVALCTAAQAEGGCTYKHRAGSPAVPFVREFTTTPVNRGSHARQGAPRIWAVAHHIKSPLNDPGTANIGDYFQREPTFDPHSQLYLSIH